MKFPGDTTLFCRSRGMLCSQTTARRSASAYRQRPQQERVNDAEDGGVGANAEYQSRNRNDGERRRAKQQPGGVAEVLCKVARSLNRAERPRRLFRVASGSLRRCIRPFTARWSPMAPSAQAACFDAGSRNPSAPRRVRRRRDDRRWRRAPGRLLAHAGVGVLQGIDSSARDHFRRVHRAERPCGILRAHPHHSPSTPS